MKAWSDEKQLRWPFDRWGAEKNHATKDLRNIFTGEKTNGAFQFLKQT